MCGSAIPRVMSKQPGPQPPPEISHCGFAGVNCTQKKAWRPLDGDLESSDFVLVRSTLPYDGNKLRVSFADYTLLFIRRELEGTTECGILLIPHRDDTTYRRVSSHVHRSAKAIQEPVDGLNVRKFSWKINIWEACGRVV